MKVTFLNNTNRFISKRSANVLEHSGFAQKLAASPKMNKAVDWLQVGSHAAMYGIISTTIKDFIGMLAYYYQSINNTKIPVEKRKYVASYELMNGVINCFMPFLLAYTVQNKHVQDEVAYALFKKRFVDPQVLAKATGAAKEALQRDMALYNTCRKGLASFSAIILAAIISKRIIAPFIAGPAAAKYKKKYLNKVDATGPERHMLHTRNSRNLKMGAINALPAATPKMKPVDA